MEHLLPEGRAVIDALEQLGQSLGYATTREHTVGRSAAIDLSWTAADSNDVPLFVFEVESTASAGLANNAMKIFGSPSKSLPKPLFFFHLVVTASPTNERIRNAQHTWGNYNYRVYRLSEAAQRRDMFVEILGQHRRVSNRIDILWLAEVAGHPFWGGIEMIPDVLGEISNLRFDTSYLHSFACLAIAHPHLLPYFTRRLRELDSGVWAAASREGYRGGPGEYIPGLLELAIRIASGDLLDAEGPEAFEKWALRTGQFPRTIDAAFGLSRDYDGFVLGIAPFQYALSMAALRKQPRSRAWVITDMYRLLLEESNQGLSPKFLLPGTTWLALMIAFEAAQHRNDSVVGKVDLEQMYLTASKIVRGAGGIPGNWLQCPPDPVSELEDFNVALDSATEGAHLPSLEDLARHASPSVGADQDSATAEAIRWCLTALVSLDAYQGPMSGIVALMGLQIPSTAEDLAP
ncbi:hypothetical protein [Subtercola lobariae]|uniref:Uncharacterized protein n=1 Tax=Subtercola lobariae TaxID=1588641 RepID=A0A917EVI0_9MICO|nr:hypothetical protein [Subtercola lobariae]GGF18138.1 hypothetical protein GCM10011399_09800 [Subtercola lobariae]